MPCYWIQIQGTCWHLTSCVPRNTYICLDNLLMWWFSLTVRRVSVVLRRTVVGCGDWRFDNLNGSHQQRKSTIAEVINSGSQQQRKSTTALLKTTITTTTITRYFCFPETKCFIVYLNFPLNNQMAKTCCCIRRAGNNCAIVSRAGYIWIWSRARDQESTNHGARFVEWKSRHITLSHVTPGSNHLLHNLLTLEAVDYQS